MAQFQGSGGKPVNIRYESKTPRVSETTLAIWPARGGSTQAFFPFLPSRGARARAMSYEGAISSLGKMRDEDGTVDRVADPPPEMWPVLAAIKYKCEVENIELVSVFEEGGGTHFGNMKTHKFFSVLKDNFQRYNFGVDVYDAIMNHYGCGYKDPRGRYENIAWKDFCEDVRHRRAPRSRPRLRPRSHPNPRRHCPAAAASCTAPPPPPTALIEIGLPASSRPHRACRACASVGVGVPVSSWTPAGWLLKGEGVRSRCEGVQRGRDPLDDARCGH